MRSSFVGSVVVVLAFTPLAARAEGRTDPATAEALFDEAKALMKAQDFGRACPKLAESQRLDPAVGTQLALALCYERAGKIASAWVTYRDVVAAARQAGQPDREKIAEERGAALADKLAYLTIVVAEPNRSLPDFALSRDGIVLNEAAFGVATPVDPGEHVLSVTARAKRPVTLRVSVGDGERRSVTIPPLEDPESEHGGAATATASTGGSSNVVAYGLLGLGAVGLGVGTFFGLRAIDASAESQDLCRVGACPRREDALARHDDAVMSANVSNVAFGIGVVALAAGTYFLLTARSSSASGAAASRPMLGGRF